MEMVRLKVLPLALSFGVLAVYLSLPSKAYYYDGIGYAETIEASAQLGPSLIHPNHLIYNTMGHVLFKTVKAFGLSVRAVDVLLVTDSVLSALGSYLFFHIVMSAVSSAYVSSVLTLLFSFSATWWEFSTDADPYIPSVFFLLACFYVLVSERRPHPILLASVHAIAVLLHQLAVLFYPVVLLGLFLQTSALPFRRRLSVLLQYSVFVFISVSSAYYFAFVWQHGGFDFPTFSRWATSYSSEAHFSFNLWRNAFYTARGFIRLFLGGRLSLVPINAFTITSAVIFLCLFVLLSLALVRNRSDLKLFFRAALKCEESLRPLLWLAMVWSVTYVVFLFFWLPYNTYYRLFYFPAILLLCGVVLARYEIINRGKRKHLALLLVAVIATYNLTFYIYPHSRVQTNEPLVSALAMKPVWSAGTVIYYQEFNTDDWTLKYFNPQTIWRKLPSGGLSALENDLRSIYESGGTAWVETTAIDLLMSESGSWLGTHATEGSKHEWVDRRVRIRLFQIVP